MLENYSSLLSLMASLTTIPLLLSPSLVCRDFIRKNSADHIRPITFVGGLMRCTLFFQHGVLMNVRPMMIVHSFGITLYCIYITLYYIYCKDKAKVTSTLGKAIAFVALLLGYANWESPSVITTRFGIIVTIVHLSLLATPLLSLKHVMKTKSTAALPFPIIFCANMVSVTWLLYGISISNNILIGQMLIGVFITGSQLLLFVIYPSKKSKIPAMKQD